MLEGAKFEEKFIVFSHFFSRCLLFWRWNILRTCDASNYYCFTNSLHVQRLKNNKTFDFSFCKSCANFVATIMEMMLFSLRARRCKYVDTKDFSTRKPNKISKGKNKNFARNQNIHKLLKPCHELKNYLSNYFQALWPTSMSSSK